MKNTIQDITDRIKIIEENNNNSHESAKDLKKLLEYLNDLLERLPEDAIKKFSESEYYDLYKKLLKDMDK